MARKRNNNSRQSNNYIQQSEKELDSMKGSIDDLSKTLNKLPKDIKNAYDPVMREMKKALEQNAKLFKDYMNGVSNVTEEMLNKSFESLKNSTKNVEEDIKEKTTNAKEAIKEAEEEIKKMDIDLKRDYTKSLAQSITKFDFSGIVSKTAQYKKDKASASFETTKKDFDTGKISSDKFSEAFKSYKGEIGKINNAASLFGKAANVLDVVAKGAKSVIDTWINRFTSGADRIVSVYESTYRNQAVLTGMNQKQYQEIQRDMKQNIFDMGLQSEITTSEVMQAASDYISKGITDITKAQQMGQASVISNALAPYLDTQSDAFISLSNALGPSFTKSMTGMGKYVSEETGSSRFIQKNMSTIIDMMEPIVMASNKQIMGDEEWLQVEKLMQSGLTQSQALAKVSNAMDVIRNPAAALESGNLVDQIQVAQGNYTDISQIIAGEYQTASQLMKGSSGLARSKLAGLLGDTSGEYYLSSDQKLQERASITGLYNKENALASPNGATTTAGEMSYEQLFRNFQQGQYTTESQKKNNLAENLATDYATIKEQWPDLMKAIETVGGTIVSGITNFLLVKFIGKLGKDLIKNIFSSGKGLFSKIGSAGKTAASGLGKAGKGIVSLGRSAGSKIGGAISKIGVSKVVGRSKFTNWWNNDGK